MYGTVLHYHASLNPSVPADIPPDMAQQTPTRHDGAPR